MSRMIAASLQVEHLSMRFGGLLALNDLSFRAQAGQITAVIGPNGAGKTTLFNCLTGFYRAPVGRMHLTLGAREHFLLERMDAYRIARDAGVIRTFQNVRLFAGMSVLENLIVAQHRDFTAQAKNPFLALIGMRSHRRALKTAVDWARYWLNRVGLLEFADASAGALPYGSQRRLEIARAMCARPALLCLDEPAAGLNPRESHQLNELLLDIRQDMGISILLIEHDMSVVMQISDYIVVLDHGVAIADGQPRNVRADPAVIRAYLGQSEGDDFDARKPPS